MKMPLLLLSLALPLVCFSACDSKFSQCEALISAMNRDEERLGPLATDAPALEEVAAKLDLASTEIGAVKVSAAELVKFRDDYQALLRDTAAGLREAAEGARTGDKAKSEAATKSMLEIGTRSGRLVEDVNQFCNAR